jgi:carbon storage regulator
MLVLTRKKGESIMIGEGIKIVVLGLDGDNVRIGIDAPRDVQIFRHEVYEAIQESNKEATQNLLDLKHISAWFQNKDSDSRGQS